MYVLEQTIAEPTCDNLPIATSAIDAECEIALPYSYNSMKYLNPYNINEVAILVEIHVIENDHQNVAHHSGPDDEVRVIILTRDQSLQSGDKQGMTC